ncbi:hypothetical protein [Mechercharimyces sp. CAU 1602]|uniref:hypothetical protein n=1 Tax=Mechercharimyces sp. CAU 1602 TaxID=2973933 RepID=UPI002161B86D|nr:hypothetical protein [Mechercharimyces sp. CAU 1602]MCS1350360.1 hypothetical protein [Mechercharimyces sp. CAU 1602]
MIDTWHSMPEVWDSDLDRQIAAMNYEILRKPKRISWKRPFFSPSSVNSCHREMYVKFKGALKDRNIDPPYRGRWKRLGTLFGDMIQRDLLFIWKHYENVVGEEPSFTVETTEIGDKRYPMWEKFAEKIHSEEHGGYSINFKGQPDGILRHKDGRRVGLEIKSKQTSAAKTSTFSMRNPDPSHVRQCIAYAIMHDLSDYILLYGNLSKKGWNLTDEEYMKNPDIRAFYLNITKKEKEELLDELSSVLEAVDTDTPPPLALDKWTFNNYKTACALSLTDEEVSVLRKEVEAMKQKGGVPQYKVRDREQALNDIEKMRSESL